MRRFPWFETLLIIVVMSISFYAAFSDAQNLSWRWFTRDDAYYYFKVAQNISEGRGSTFDGINPTNGYHPLWMLVCVPIFALARFDLILPLRVLLLVMSGLSVATGILLYRLIGRVFVPAIGAIAALFWVFSYDVLVVVYQQGLETGIAAFFVVLLIYKLYKFERSWRKEGVTRKQVMALGIIALLTIFSRLDLVFLAGMVGLWVVFRGHPLRYYLPLDIASILVSAMLAFIMRVGFNAYYHFADIALTMAGVGLVVKIPCAFLFGLYQHSDISKPGESLRRLVLASLTGSAILGAVMLAIMGLGLLDGSFPRVTILTDIVLTFLFLRISRLIVMGLQSEKTVTHPDEKPRAYFLAHWKQWLAEGVNYYGIVLGGLGIYMVWNVLAFGTASPVSGQVKRWWGSLPGRTYGGPAREALSFFGINYASDANAWHPVSTLIGSWAELLYRIRILDTYRYLLLLALLAILFFLLLRIDRQKGKTALAQLGIIPLLSAAFLQVLYYHAPGYAAYKDWYWISQLVIIVLALSLMLGMVYRLIRRIPYAHLLAWLLAAYVGVNMGASFWRTIRDAMPYNYWPPDTAYMDIAPLLEKYTEPGSMIGLTGGGNVAYFVDDRTIVNMDGLINSYPYFQALQSRQAGVYLESIGLDYVLANPVILSQLPYRAQFDEYLVPLNIHYGGKQLMRYRAP